MSTIKVTKISFEGHEINIPGLNGLLSDISLWSTENHEIHQGYEREVIKKNGKFTTILRKVG